MANAAIFGLTQETAMTAAARFPLQETDTATRATSATFALMGGLEHATGSDAATAMAVGTLYTVDMSAWATATRIYSLPTTAQVGERVGVYIVAGNATHELAIRTTAASGDTINGTARDSSDWSMLFITGEFVVFRCIVADTAWIVEVDGRIPCNTRIYLATTTTGGVLGTGGVFSQAPFDSTKFDVGGLADLANDRITFRRAGKYLCAFSGGFSTVGGGKKYIGAIFDDNTPTELIRGTRGVAGGSDVVGSVTAGAVSIAASDLGAGTGHVTGHLFHNDTVAREAVGDSVGAITALSAIEILAP